MNCSSPGLIQATQLWLSVKWQKYSGKGEGQWLELGLGLLSN